MSSPRAHPGVKYLAIPESAVPNDYILGIKSVLFSLPTLLVLGGGGGGGVVSFQCNLFMYLVSSVFSLIIINHPPRPSLASNVQKGGYKKCIKQN